MGLNLNHYELRVIDEKSNEGFAGEGAVTSGVLVVAYDAGTKTLATVKADDKGTAKTNPISRAQFATDGGKVDFYSSASSIDLFIADDKGNMNFFAGVTPNDHVLFLDKSSVLKCLVAPFSASDNTEVDTGVDFPRDVIIERAYVKVHTTDATETIDVGILSSETNGDANGILAAVSVANSGIVQPVAVTVGGSETYVSTYSYGLLMGGGVVGTNTNGDFGLAVVPGHVVTGANGRSLSYTGSSGSDTAAGLIFCFFRHL